MNVEKMSDTDQLKELKAIKKLLVLMALKNGASPDDIDTATGMGAGNVRAMFPGSQRKKRIPPMNQDATV